MKRKNYYKEAQEMISDQNPAIASAMTNNAMDIKPENDFSKIQSYGMRENAYEAINNATEFENFIKQSREKVNEEIQSIYSKSLLLFNRKKEKDPNTSSDLKKILDRYKYKGIM